MDRISHLPDNVVDRILCSLSILDAVKTCILARAWRYKWAALSKLTFDGESWVGISDDRIRTYKFVKIVTSALLQHIGPLHELHLQVPWSFEAQSEFLIPSIQFALRKDVKTLSLKCCVVPTCIFSSTKLTHLDFESFKCPFSPPVSFGGLTNLVSFNLTSWYIIQDADKIMKFISSCPKLKRLSLSIRVVKAVQIHAPTLEYLSIKGFFPCICFQETENVRELLVMLIDDSFCLAKKCRKMNIFSGLVKLESLRLETYALQLVASAGVPRRFPGILDQLKILELPRIELGRSDELCGLLCLLASSPKLWKLSITTLDGWPDAEFDFKSYTEFYKDHKCESLCTVEFVVRHDEYVIEMIDLLLGCSPNLEVMYIKYQCEGMVDALKKVNRLTRASPKAMVNFMSSSDESDEG